jgi:hypothetical protein
VFWEPTNLVAACRRCNYGDGSRIAAENTRRTIERLRALVEEQRAQIDRLLETIARYEDANGAISCPRQPGPNSSWALRGLTGARGSSIATHRRRTCRPPSPNIALVRRHIRNGHGSEVAEGLRVEASIGAASKRRHRVRHL